MLADPSVLVWQPAHQSIASVGECKLSGSSRMSLLDWRAKRLVDALAKQAAQVRAPPSAITRLLEWGQSAIHHAGKKLG